jgi:hypothetical protein
MPWYEYSFTPNGGSKPLVAVRLLNGNRRVRLLALVDSGADRSLLDAQYADLLGLDRADAQVIEAIVANGDNAEVLYWPHAPLELQFENERFPFRGSFIDFPSGADPQNLMGRLDFFEQYIVQFWDAQALMCIDLSPDLPKPGHTVP